MSSSAVRAAPPPTSVCHSSSKSCSANSKGFLAASPAATRTPAACASGSFTIGDSVAGMPFHRRFI
eukprot:3839558-Pleurochrysis_carterae.AAC.1